MGLANGPKSDLKCRRREAAWSSVGVSSWTSPLITATMHMPMHVSGHAHIYEHVLARAYEQVPSCPCPPSPIPAPMCDRECARVHVHVCVSMCPYLTYIRLPNYFCTHGRGMRCCCQSVASTTSLSCYDIKHLPIWSKKYLFSKSFAEVCHCTALPSLAR